MKFKNGFKDNFSSKLKLQLRQKTDEITVAVTTVLLDDGY